MPIWSHINHCTDMTGFLRVKMFGKFDSFELVDKIGNDHPPNIRQEMFLKTFSTNADILDNNRRNLKEALFDRNCTE